MKYTKTLGSVALSALLLMGMTGCSDDDNTYIPPVAETPAPETPVADPTISPYQRVAVIPGTWDDVPGIADKIAQFVTLTDEDADLGFESGGWLIGGAKTSLNGGGETYEFKDLLPIPAMGVAADTTAVKKSRVIEFCNGKYATMAMKTGLRHGPALPCEVSVHSDGENIFIDMLDADAIFSIFFHDISDPDGTLEVVASNVKSELRTMVLAALNDATVVAANATADGTNITTDPLLTTVVTYDESTEALGPKFSATDISDSVSYRDPYIVYRYTSPDTVFTQADAKNLAKDIITALGDDVDFANTTPGLEGLSAGSKWRSGREAPLGIPGVFIAEACSPKYASKATTLGNEYITALPCEISVYVDDTAADYSTTDGIITTGTGSIISISFLNPNFMFGTMFEGAVPNALENGTIDKTGAIEYSTLADVVFSDLRMIVDRAIQAPVTEDAFAHTLTIIE